MPYIGKYAINRYIYLFNTSNNVTDYAIVVGYAIANMSNVKSINVSRETVNTNN